jgi:hypothetical protein
MFPGVPQKRSLMSLKFFVRYKRTIAVAILVAFTSLTVEAVGGRKAAYFGGTDIQFAGAENEVDGQLNTADAETLIFTAEEKPFAGKVVGIPYARIVDLEYGQKAGRRVGAAVGYTILLGPLGLLTLFSKKRKHYLTIGYTDAAGKDQVAVLELGKDIVRATLPIVETRSGKKIEYQDEEAKKAAGR